MDPSLAELIVQRNLSPQNFIWRNCPLISILEFHFCSLQAILKQLLVHLKFRMILEDTLLASEPTVPGLPPQAMQSPLFLQLETMCPTPSWLLHIPMSALLSMPFLQL